MLEWFASNIFLAISQHNQRRSVILEEDPTADRGDLRLVPDLARKQQDGHTFIHARMVELYQAKDGELHDLDKYEDDGSDSPAAEKQLQEELHCGLSTDKTRDVIESIGNEIRLELVEVDNWEDGSDTESSICSDNEFDFELVTWLRKLIYILAHLLALGLLLVSFLHLISWIGLLTKDRVSCTLQALEFLRIKFCKRSSGRTDYIVHQTICCLGILTDTFHTSFNQVKRWAVWEVTKTHRESPLLPEPVHFTNSTFNSLASLTTLVTFVEPLTAYLHIAALSIIHCGQVAREYQLPNAGELAQGYNTIYRTMDDLVGEVDTIAEGVWVLINEADLSLSSLVSRIKSVQAAVPPPSQPSNFSLPSLDSHPAQYRLGSKHPSIKSPRPAIHAAIRALNKPNHPSHPRNQTRVSNLRLSGSHLQHHQPPPHC